MENFQYSVHLSDQDWAEFSAAAEECGLLQAGLASGDELLSSDIDQGDSSGSSPPEPLPLFGGHLAPRGRGWPGFEEEEDKAATQQLVSRSWQEPVLALGAGQQMPSTSAPSEAQPSLSPGATPPGQSPSLRGPETSRDKMQRLLQGPAPRDSAPSVPGEPPRSPESPGRSTAPQKPPGSPGAPPRSPSRKKRRTAGAKGGGRPGAASSAPTQPGSPRLTEARPEEGLGPAGSRGKGLSAGTAEQIAGARQDELGPESAGTHEQVAGQRPGLDLSTTEQGTDLLKMTPRAELHTVSRPAQEAGPDVSMAKSDTALSTPACQPQADSALSTPARKPQADTALSTPARKPQADTALSTPARKPQADTALSTPARKPQADTALSTPARKPQADMALSTPALKPQDDTALSTPAHKPILDVDLPVLGPVVKPEVDSCIPVSKAQCEVGASTLALSLQTEADMAEAEVAPSAKLDLSSATSSGAQQEKPRGEPSAGAPGNHSGEPPTGSVQAPKKKKVRFSVAMPSPEEPGPEEASGPLSPATAWPSAPRTAAGGRGGPGAWDAVAVGPRLPQPRILKHLPPPPSVASGGPGYRSCFAVTLPEAYEFFFCDTIAEEDEEAEEAAEDSQVPAEVQWPDVCEFFFRDCRAQMSGPRTGRSPPPPPPPKAEPVLSPVPGDPMPISIPEAYEHFLGEDRLGDLLGPAALRQLQATELPRLAPQGVEPGTPPETSQATAQQLDLVVRQAGEPRGPLTAFTFSQNDMCLVFVAFATWAVRTSDLHTPDAWKTVLLANIGTISAIRYFRRQVRRGRPSPSPSS
ncbi:PREDICTED: PGC-1 and ERR-induced regulator in muscle protein 1 [Hipposideros armiger]|uniref:PGC-1 and ERR-induced regulator in muscle protein 1 n=1 Tax=Hipposideros armiger TaxID=186990 RepID=A0A8B7SKQ0_HIPAR|nr:PREDICTED: PGC-1 and ERR-induced regulator in muscle protein 1 [Hipposideros armiger]XP_019513963.1 PREDICTED: PGC-1 and ERR-induced regulator in muscle protein 1 [Hipposideros armiger]